jgi:hypothetical protein
MEYLELLAKSEGVERERCGGEALRRDIERVSERARERDAAKRRCSAP